MKELSLLYKSFNWSITRNILHEISPIRHAPSDFIVVMNKIRVIYKMQKWNAASRMLFSRALSPCLLFVFRSHLAAARWAYFLLWQCYMIERTRDCSSVVEQEVVFK